MAQSAEVVTEKHYTLFHKVSWENENKRLLLSGIGHFLANLLPAIIFFTSLCDIGLIQKLIKSFIT
jgi:hypothetical protein